MFVANVAWLTEQAFGYPQLRWDFQVLLNFYYCCLCLLMGAEGYFPLPLIR